MQQQLMEENRALKLERARYLQSGHSMLPSTPKHSIRSVSGQSAESVNPLRCNSRYSLSSSVNSNLGPMDTSDLNTSDLNDSLNDSVDFFCGDIVDSLIQADHQT